ncbi:MAG: hypothetical protein GC137_02310 [Alphaproteobacteria bacterium]|nr:hypothetical protein [Alphaproteobacteria bacterium]
MANEQDPKNLLGQFNRAAPGDREALVAAFEAQIARAPGLKEALEKRGIDLTQDDTPLEIFGYGSLPSQPHFSSKDIKTEGAEFKVVNGLAGGFKRDLVVPCSRSGKNNDPGLVFGLDRDKSAAQYGGILSYTGLSLAEKTDNMRIFLDRELMAVNGEPGYVIDIIDVEAADGNVYPCLVCLSNDKSPEYQGGLSYEEKVARIARVHNAVEVDGSAPERADSNTTVPDVRNVRSAMGYFYSFAIMTIGLRGELPEPTSDFEARYKAAVEAEDERFLSMHADIERYRATQLTPQQQLFRLQADWKHADWFKDMGSNPVRHQMVRERLADLEQRIETLKQSMEQSSPAPESVFGSQPPDGPV